MATSRSDRRTRSPRARPKGAAAASQSGTRTIARLLIANRGEIALRVLRACRDLGIAPIVAYSDADRDTLPVRLADEARRLGPAPARESYLDIGAVVAAARDSGADAVHPGYGFLAENPDFAQACEGAGLIFVGPPASAMRLVGDKVEARRLAASCGVPIIPGIAGRAGDVEELRSFARRVGYPILIKAAAGGGGRGMRIVRDEADLEAALRTARSEAQAAFGDDGVYAEKLLEGVRHIEIQVLADNFGNLMHLGERECSVQRRHQKLIEESPSAALSPAGRARIGDLALRVMRAAGYRNAGTVEFLVDAAGEAFFIEVNARIQVEHPVTELVTGIDLVRAQIRLAMGAPLEAAPAGGARGWAIECRILAEDPARGFQPSPGRVAFLRLPAGPGVRVDTALEAGDEVPLHYDPLVAKVVAWGRDRPEALARLRRALDEIVIAGVRTTVPFHRQVLADDDFGAARIDIGYGERVLARFVAAPASDNGSEIAAVAAALAATLESGRAAADTAPAAISPWALEGRRAHMRSREPRRSSRPQCA